MDYKINNIINGNEVTSSSKETFKSVNPANTEDTLSEFPLADKNDVQKAIKAAHEAFPDWAGTSAIKRADVLYNLIYLVQKNKDALARLITREIGKTFLAAQKEVDAAVQALKHFSGAANRISGETIPANNPEAFTYTLKEPLGVVGAIAPFNFPLGIAVYKIAPAMLAGNTVVFKPAPDASCISYELMKLFQEAGLPNGVVNLIIGDKEAGEEIGRNKHIKAVSFTGSTAVGTKLGQDVHARGGKMQAEMGGKNATLILDDADIEEAANGVIISGMYNNGQSCTGTSRVLVSKELAPSFTALLVEKAKSIVVNEGFTEEAENGAVANKKQLNTYLHYIDKAVEEGAKIECGGKQLLDGDKSKGYFVSPTVLTNVTSNHTVAQEEIFGPVVAIITVDDFDEAITIANDTNFGLSSAIFTKDLEKAMHFVKRIETGVTHVNIPSNHYENQLPFGGKKNSSIGPREQGTAALEFWMDTKAVYLKP